MPFGKVICTSVNDAVLHGLPHDYALRDGDLLSSTSPRRSTAGSPTPRCRRRRHARASEDVRLIDTTERALDAGIAAARPGNRIGDISAAIGEVARAAGLPVNTALRRPRRRPHMHGDPHVPNDGRRRPRLPLEPGLVIAIEPWFLETTDEIFTDPDGWTLRSADGSRGAHTSTRSRSPTAARSS